MKRIFRNFTPVFVFLLIFVVPAGVYSAQTDKCKTTLSELETEIKTTLMGRLQTLFQTRVPEYYCRFVLGNPSRTIDDCKAIVYADHFKTQYASFRIFYQEIGFIDRYEPVPLEDFLEDHRWASQRLAVLEQRLVEPLSEPARQDSPRVGSPRPKPETYKQDLTKIVNGLSQLIANPDFSAIVAREERFRSAVSNYTYCMKYLKSECPVSTTREMLAPVLDLFEKSNTTTFAEADWLRHVYGRATDVYLKQNPRITVEHRKDANEELILHLPLAPGDSATQNWNSIYEEVKSAVEGFWNGVFKKGGRLVRFSVKVDETTSTAEAGKPEAVLVNVVDMEGWNSTAALGGGKLNFDINILNQELSAYQAVIAHETGHTLGFPDRYGYVLDQQKCSVVPLVERDDIMTSFPHPVLGADQLKELYGTYALGKNDNPLWDSITALVKRCYASEMKQKSKK